MEITTTGAVNSLNGNRWNRLKAIVSEMGEDWESAMPRGRLLEPGKRNYDIAVTTVGFGTKNQIDVGMKGIGTEPNGDLYLLEEESMALTRSGGSSSVTYETPVVYETKGTTKSKENGWFRVTAFGPVAESNFNGPQIPSSQVNWSGANPFPGRTFEQDFFYGPGGNPSDLPSGQVVGDVGWSCTRRSVCTQGGGITENGEEITIVNSPPPSFGVVPNQQCPNKVTTKSGECAVGTRTIATDQSVIPELKWIQLLEPIMSTWTDIGGTTHNDDTFENLRAEDTGNKIEGRDIDLFLGSFTSADGFGGQTGDEMKQVKYCGGGQQSPCN